MKHFVIILLTAVFGLIGSAQAKEWVVVRMDKSSYNQKINYVYGMQESGSDIIYSTVIELRELKPLLRLLKIDQPAQLIGKKFTADNWTEAFQETIDKLQPSKYLDISDKDIFEMSAQSLCRMKIPDLSPVSKKRVFQSFNSVWEWETGRVRDAWLSSFAKRVKDLSNGRVKLQRSEMSNFKTRVNGPAEYVELISDNNKMFVIMTPSETPFHLDFKVIK